MPTPRSSRWPTTPTASNSGRWKTSLPRCGGTAPGASSWSGGCPGLIWWTVVLKRGVILAVEAAEGTDAAIRRGAGLAAGSVVVKAARPDQDPRFDLPTIGAQTVALLRDVGATVLAVEAGKTLLLDRHEAV